MLHNQKHERDEKKWTKEKAIKRAREKEKRQMKIAKREREEVFIWLKYGSFCKNYLITIHAIIIR